MTLALLSRSNRFLLGTALSLISGSMAFSAYADSQNQAASSDGLEEIIVTGTKRAEKFIDLPIAASVFSAATIAKAGITRPQDFLRLVPNVTFIQSNQAGEAYVNIRGQATIRLAQPSVAYVVDGVQLADPNSFNGEMFDLSQIEVLKGPQSALYGRNASAGAVIINTVAPSNELEGFVTIGYGNWNSTLAQAAVGGAIIKDKLLFRASASFTDTDGPFTNIVTGEKVMRSNEKVGRLRFTYKANDNLDLDFKFSGSHLNGGAIAWNSQVAGTTVGGVPVAGIDANKTDIPYVSDVNGLDIQDKYDISLIIKYKLDIGTFTSTSAWSQVIDNYQAKNFPYAAYGVSGSDFGVFEGVFGSRTQKLRIKNKAFTQELRLTSNNDQRLRWMAGVYFLTSNRRMITENGLDATGVILPNWGINGVNSANPTDNYDENKFTTTSYAPFANIDFDITKDLVLGVAGRYDIEKQGITTMTPDIPNPLFGSSVGAQGATYNLCVLYTGLAASDCHKSETFKQFEPKVTLTYKFPERGSIFLSYGKGFKSGGFNPIGTRAALLHAPGVDPALIFVQDGYGKETTDAYEAGFKSRWLDDRLSINGSVFWTEVKDAQQFEFFPSTGIQAVSQIDKERIKGAELEFNAIPAKGLNIFAGFGYNDARIRKLIADPSFVGNRVPYSAKYNISAGIQYTQPVTDAMDVVTRVDYSRTGSVWWDASNLPGTERKPVDLVNARIGLSTDKWQLNLWSENLFNKRYNTEDIPLLSIVNATYKAPTRSFGVKGTFRF